MSIIKNGKEYEYNIDGDLVPKGSVTLKNMYGDFDNRWIPKKERKTDSDWDKSVDRLFATLDPKSGASQEESDKAVEGFFDDVDTENQETIT